MKTSTSSPPSSTSPRTSACAPSPKESRRRAARRALRASAATKHRASCSPGPFWPPTSRPHFSKLPGEPRRTRGSSSRRLRASSLVRVYGDPAPCPRSTAGAHGGSNSWPACARRLLAARVPQQLSGARHVQVLAGAARIAPRSSACCSFCRHAPARRAQLARRAAAFPACADFEGKLNMTTASSPYPLRLEGDARPPAQPLAVARQMAAGDPARHRARVPVDRLPRAVAGRVRRDPVHRPLPARDLRLQRRRAALDLARGLLLLQRARHRPLPAVHARRRRRLPGAAGRRVPAGALARTGRS